MLAPALIGILAFVIRRHLRLAMEPIGILITTSAAPHRPIATGQPAKDETSRENTGGATELEDGGHMLIIFI
jgi:hypothetical protein